ncbi:hypothetical protein Rhopal_004126-T1 [Rhodotorula paludigena]|uniref:Outer spore wall protein RRT8 n=1 Tax=Rhodotorula paludigena TaxID=86838 RepID=A0AAV5GLM2_9BASI|nr:hypothetical protein Rhopal_004126-T1 [Rhodotorula paludigena]
MPSDTGKPSRIQRELDKGLAYAKDDAKAIGSLGADAVKSTAYLYPIYGVVYFAKHPKLLESLKPLIIRSLSISLVTLSVMATFAYLPQAAVLTVILGPLSLIAAIPLVLAESYFIILFLHRTFLTPAVSERIFDAVLVQKGHSALVEQGRALNKRGGSVELGKSLLSPVASKFSMQGVVRYFVTLPLNLIPGVGTAIFLLLNGRKAGPAAHDRYFQLKKMDKKAKQQFVEQRSAAYTSFGAASLLLGLIPLFGPATAFTSAAGAALWAADLEKKSQGGGKGGELGGKDENVDVGVGHVEL